MSPHTTSCGALVRRALLLVVVPLVVGGCIRRGPNASTPPVLYGYVMKVSGRDTSFVASARVYTSPESNVVVTDSAGYWAIGDGLAPGNYKVMAELAGVKAQVLRVPASMGTSQRVVLILGADDSPWPPSESFEHFLPVPPKAPAIGRFTCCD